MRGEAGEVKGMEVKRLGEQLPQSLTNLLFLCKLAVHS